MVIQGAMKQTDPKSFGILKKTSQKGFETILDLSGISEIF